MGSYTVARAFLDIDGITRQPGWQVELPLHRALKLYRWGYIVGPVYRPVPPEPWQVIHGTARRVTSREENVAGLASAIALANDLKVSINDSYADIADHTTAPDPNVIASPNPLTIPALITIVTEMLVSYNAHDDDAEIAGPGPWAYHAAQEAGDHTLASVAAPVNLQECITRLNDIKAKFNGHDADATCHGVGSNHQVITANADYGPVVRFSVRGAESTDLIAWGILDAGTGTVVGVRATPGDSYVDFEFDADPQNDCIISYMVSRKLP